MLTDTKENIQRDRAALERELMAAGAKVRGTVSSCPFHDDTNPSGSIKQGDDGAWRFKCFVCDFKPMDVFDVKARAENRPVGDVLKEMTGPRPGATATAKEPPRVHRTRSALEAGARWSREDSGPTLTIETTYKYTDPVSGKIDLEIFRLLKPSGKKTFKMAAPANGGWMLAEPPKPWPIYNRTRLVAAEVVIVAEGEKCVHALTDVLPDRFAATTSPSGAGKAKSANWVPLAGKRVYVWPDADEPGHRHAADVIDILQRLDPPAEVYLLDPEALGLSSPGDDVVDFLAAFGGESVESKRDAIDLALAKAQPISATADLYQRIENVATGRYAATAIPGCPALHRLGQPLLPGSLLVLAGDPGDGKSLLVLQWLMELHRAGVPVAMFELEEDRPFWLTRALALLDGQGELTRPAWVHEHADDARAAYQRHKAELDRFAPRLEVAGDRQVTHAEIIAWVKARAAAGCRVIAIDPATALAATEKPWLDDLRLVIELKAIARQFGCSLILVTHPRGRRGAKGAPTLDDIAGGLAFPRFAQTVFWVWWHEKGRQCRWASSVGGDSSGRVNRSVRIAKARNGPGGGMEVAFHFDGGSLRFLERGVIIDDDTEADE